MVIIKKRWWRPWRIQCAICVLALPRQITEDHECVIFFY
jgi:hypothetical protein